MSSLKIGWHNPHLSTAILTSAAREALPVHDLFPFTLNAYSMVHYAPLIDTLASRLNLRRLVEVGVFDGDFSLYVLQLAQRIGAAADFIDIEFKPEARARIETATPKDITVSFHEQASRNALRDVDPIDLVFLDGDHNWETVGKELALISEASGKRIVLMHDVGWPCGRRDIAYEPTYLSDKESFRIGQLSPFSEEMVSEFGLPFPGSKLWEGGAKNGVLGAIEEFRAARGSEWSYWSIPLFFGLGVLWSRENVSPEEHSHLLSVGEIYKEAAPLMAAAELNRLMMLIRLQNDGEVWRRMNEKIEELKSIRNP